MPDDLVSIVIPAYNPASYLAGGDFLGRPRKPTLTSKLY